MRVTERRKVRGVLALPPSAAAARLLSSLSHQKIEADDDGRTYQLGRRGALCLLPALRSLFGSHFQCHCKYLHCRFSSAGVQKFIQVDFHTLLLLVVSVERTGFYHVYNVGLLLEV